MKKNVFCAAAVLLAVLLCASCGGTDNAAAESFASFVEEALGDSLSSEGAGELLEEPGDHPADGSAEKQENDPAESLPSDSGTAQDSAASADATEQSLAPTVTVGEDGQTIAFDPATRIRRTTPDLQGLPLDMYYEIPVFAENTIGYQKINVFFQNLEDSFLSPDGENYTWVMESAAELADRGNPYNETYINTWDAVILDETDWMVCVSQSYSWYLGGVFDYGTNNYTFRTDTGDLLRLPDVVSGTGAEITDMIVAAMEEQYEGIDGDALANIRKIAPEDFDFYIFDGLVHVAFDKYEISYGAAGAFDVELPAELNPQWK